MKTISLIAYSLLIALMPVVAMAQSKHPQGLKNIVNRMKAEWYASDEAYRVADSLLAYQYPCGGWAKNHDWHTLESDSKMKERRNILRQIAQGESIGATIDNGATTREMLFLAKLYASNVSTAKRKSSLRKYRDAFVRGLNYLLEAQYDNGGWPQFYPLKPLDNEGHPFYSNHITFNDDAMYNIMVMLREIYEQRPPYDAVKLDEALLSKTRTAFDRGIDCILNCQIRKDGKLTVWCQQHDEKTFAPAAARSYELASFTGSHETASLLQLLMSLENPSQRVVDAVTAAVEWLQLHALKDMKLQMFTNKDGKYDRRLVHQFGHQTWARYYDLKTEEPYVCDRDGVPQPSLEYIGYERRNGYGWYGDTPQDIIDRFPKWIEKVSVR